MADEITGLGQVSDDSSYLSLGTLLDTLESEEARRESQIIPMRELKASGGYIKRVEGTRTSEYPLDERARRAMGSFLSIPVPYLSRISNSLAEQNIDWHFRQSPDVNIELISVEGEIVDARSPQTMSVTALETTRVLAKVMGSDALVNRVSYGLNHTTMDISNPAVQMAPAHRVGDVTYGGLRITLPKGDFAPEVGTYLHRLVCTNGLFSVAQGDSFTIKGMTHPDVLDMLEMTASNVWNRLPEMLDAYVALDDRPVADPVRMVQVYGVENGISPRYIAEALALVTDALAIMPDRAWSLYDIVQVFTSLIHLDSVKENTRNKLMALGGNMVASSAEERRCTTCAHLLTA